MKEHRSFRIPRLLPLTVHCLLLTGVLALSCGGDGDKEDGGTTATQKKNRFAYGGTIKVTISGVSTSVDGSYEFSQSPSKIAPNLKTTPDGGVCVIHGSGLTAGAYDVGASRSVGASGDERVSVNVNFKEQPYQGPGTYNKATANLESMGTRWDPCTLTVNPDEKSGSFSCSDPTGPKMEGTFACTHEFVEFDS